MRTIIKIKELGLPKLNNSEYTQFLSNVVRLVETAGLNNVGVEEEVFLAFKQNVKQLSDLGTQTKSSTETQELAVLDKKRDEMVSYLIAHIKNERKTSIERKKNASLVLYNIAKPFTGIQNLPNRQETQQIETLISQITTKPNREHLATLGLEEVVTELQSSNQRYKEITATRADSQLESPLINTKKIRLETDKQYDYFTTMAFVYSVMYENQEIKNFVTSINKLIEDTNMAYKQRMGHTRRTESAS